VSTVKLFTGLILCVQSIRHVGIHCNKTTDQSQKSQQLGLLTVPRHAWTDLLHRNRPVVRLNHCTSGHYLCATLVVTFKFLIYYYINITETTGNSPGDEIPNVTFLRLRRTRTLRHKNSIVTFIRCFILTYLHDDSIIFISSLRPVSIIVQNNTIDQMYQMIKVSLNTVKLTVLLRE